MRWNISSLDLLLYITAFFVTSLPASCLEKWPVSGPRGLFIDDKMRLGSMPPSCHNRCGECNPCMAAKEPTVPTEGPVEPRLGNDVRGYVSSSPSISKYSDYKPLGWKCRCGDHLFNP